MFRWKTTNNWYNPADIPNNLIQYNSDETMIKVELNRLNWWDGLGWMKWEGWVGWGGWGQYKAFNNINALTTHRMMTQLIDWWLMQNFIGLLQEWAGCSNTRELCVVVLRSRLRWNSVGESSQYNNNSMFCRRSQMVWSQSQVFTSRQRCRRSEEHHILLRKSGRWGEYPTHSWLRVVDYY